MRLLSNWPDHVAGLGKQPRPDEEAINKAMSGHICRSGMPKFEQSILLREDKRRARIVMKDEVNMRHRTNEAIRYQCGFLPVGVQVPRFRHREGWVVTVNW